MPLSCIRIRTAAKIIREKDAHDTKASAVYKETD